METEHGEASEAPATERAGNRYAEPKTTAPHLDSTISGVSPYESCMASPELPRFSGTWAKVEDNDVVVIEQNQDNNESEVERFR